MLNKKPLPYIQNHINWCWAVAAKLVGFNYLSMKNKSFPFDFDIRYPFGIERKNKYGLIYSCVGNFEDCITVDAWQSKIVENAKHQDNNPLGDLAEYDIAKVRALKYISMERFNSNT